MKKIFQLFVFLIIFTVCLSACGKTAASDTDSSRQNTVYSISLDKKELYMDVFDADERIISTLKVNGAETQGKIEWKSSNVSVATVSENGIVSSVGVGECEITACYKDESAKCKVFVTSESIPALYVETETISLNLGVSDPYKIRAYVVFKSQKFYDDAEFSYTFSNDGVVSVNTSGYVTAVGVGETTVTVNAVFRGYSGLGMTAKVTVNVFE